MEREQIHYEELSDCDIPEACEMVKEVYDHYVSSENTDKGNQFFYDFIQPDAMKQRLSEKSFAIVAKIDQKIYGLIEIKDDNHVCLLFVKREMQRKGVAKSLFTLAVEKCIRKQKEYIDVNSSLYAVPIYQKLGFSIHGEEQFVNGIHFVQMVFTLKD